MAKSMDNEGGRKGQNNRAGHLRKVEEVLDSGALGALSSARWPEEDHDLAWVECRLLEKLFEKLKLLHSKMNE